MIGVGVGEILVIGGAVLLLFGARKIPMIARGLGEGIRNFKGEVKQPPVEPGKTPPALEEGKRGSRPDPDS